MQRSTQRYLGSRVQTCLLHLFRVPAVTSPLPLPIPTGAKRCSWSLLPNSSTAPGQLQPSSHQEGGIREKAAKENQNLCPLWAFYAKHRASGSSLTTSNAISAHLCFCQQQSLIRSQTPGRSCTRWEEHKAATREPQGRQCPSLRRGTSCYAARGGSMQRTGTLFKGGSRPG